MDRQQLKKIYGEPLQQITNESVIKIQKDAMKEGLGADLPAEWLKVWTARPDVCTKALRLKMMRINSKSLRLRRDALDRFMADTFTFPAKKSSEEIRSSTPEPASVPALPLIELGASTSKAPASSSSIETGPSASSQLISKSPLKRLNTIRHGISISEKKLASLRQKVIKEKGELLAIKEKKGHFSLKNVTKREERSVLVRKRLRVENIKLKKQVVEQRKELGMLKEQLLQLEMMQMKNFRQKRQIKELQKGKRRADRRASFHLNEKARILKEVREREQLEKMQAEEGTRQIVTFQGRKYKEMMRMCVLELAGLEVATGKIGEVIRCVCGRICDVKCSHLPSRQACQNIMDEGQFIIKRMLGEKLQDCKAWGLHKDGTSRKKVKILDTSIHTEDGSSFCLGFTSVVSETGEAIAEEAKQKIGEVSEAVGEEGIRKELLMKMTYFMNDRAGNEKKSSRLLEQWRGQALKEEGEEKAPEVLHLFCSAHVLLGFHTYTLKHLSEMAKDQLKHPVAALLRDASDLFGPVGDYRGLRNVWLAHCHDANEKSYIQNYKDNRFNGLFEVSAQVYFHHEKFLKILQTRSSTNNKQTRVLKALQDPNLLTILECLGLFFFKITGPFWILVTSLHVQFSSLPKVIQHLEKGLSESAKNPSLLFLEDTFGIKKLKSNSALMEHKFATEIKNPFMAEIIKKVSKAFSDTIHAQLADYLQDGKFGEKEGEKKLERVPFAPLNNLVSERNFGLLDASQKRRPSASLHHHSSVIMLKQSKERLGKYIGSLSPGMRKLMWARAMVMGKTLRKTHREQDKQVQQGCLPVASTPRQKSSRKRRAPPEEPSLPTPVREGEMIAVACEDRWYPAIVLDIKDGDNLAVDFAELGRGLGTFKWPNGHSIDTISRRSVLSTNLEVEPRAGGRFWIVQNAKKIQDKFQK